jgi:hypothetical protein
MTARSSLITVKLWFQQSLDSQSLFGAILVQVIDDGPGITKKTIEESLSVESICFGLKVVHKLVES